MAAFELGVGLADSRQRVDVRDRHIDVSVGDQAGKLGAHFGARPGRVPRQSSPALLGSREIGAGVDPIGRDAEGGVSSTYPSPNAAMKASTPLGAGP
ncbi:hypothetical protein [Streptomyces sp. WAC01280]|uniref:hypothetical protein n=1 Tax=Streptomyces sp. WAC01280 TaxID=2487424 RepID=UPI0021AE3461|nr:hypothetical protein [Streptomyces sp. WAC01280]